MESNLLKKLKDVGVGGLAPTKRTDINPDKYAKQLELEQWQVREGVKRYNKEKNKNIKRGRESNTSYGLHLLKRDIQEVSDLIRRDVKKAFESKSYFVHTAIPFLLQIEDDNGRFNPDVVAYLGLRCVLDSITMKQTLQKASIRIGSALQDEVNFRHFSQEAEHTYNKVRKDLRERTRHLEQKRYAFLRAMKNKGVDITDWGSKQSQIGLWVIGRLLQIKKPIIEVKLLRERRKKPMKYIVPTPNTRKWINEKIERHQLLTPKFVPTIIKPKRWTRPFQGGYHGQTRQQTLIKTKNSRHFEDISNKVDEMKSIYEAINNLQNTAWVVNKPVLEVMETLWKKGVYVKDMPQNEALPLPPHPVNFDTETKEGKLKFKEWRHANKDKWRDWKHSANKIHHTNTKNESKQLQVDKVIFVANKFKDEEEIFFPHQMDFRGRCYPTPDFLNPQGAPYSRALLKFKNSYRMGDDESSGGWLAVHGATMYGKDKLSYEERIKFIKDNEDKIIACAEDPYTNDWWMTAGDSPYGFLAFCYEWKGYCEHGDNFKTSLPVALDGTCNGLQIFSLLLRDEEGGMNTNLIPTDEPQDIYKIVADKVQHHLENETDDRIYLGFKSKRQLAQDWIKFEGGINRKICKRPVMIVPYSGTLFACREYIEDFVEDAKEEGRWHTWMKNNDECLKPPTQYLANIIWAKISETIPKAREGMRWLRKISNIISRLNVSIKWTTPMGFPVQQSYRTVTQRRVETKMGDSIIKLTYNEDTDDINRSRQRAGISPNFIHSLDACAMLMTVNRMKKMGIDDYWMIHDSYGTNAVFVGKMSQALREVFHEMFSENILEKFRDEVLEVVETIEDSDYNGKGAEEREKIYKSVPPIPKMGNLNIDDLLNSEYFFS